MLPIVQSKIGLTYCIFYVPANADFSPFCLVLNYKSVLYLNAVTTRRIKSSYTKLHMLDIL